MEQDAVVAPERPASSPGRLNLLHSACISLAAGQASPPGADSDSEAMERRERGSPAATAPDGPLPGAAPQNESSDADIFFEYDVESGPACSASGGAAGGADTGCALTSPAGDSRDPSPVPPAAAAATCATAVDAATTAAVPSAGDCQLARSAAVPVPGGGRNGGDYARSAERPVPAQNGRRRVVGGSLGQRPQQSPGEKVDAWLRACHDDSGGSAEEEETGEQGAAAAAAPAPAPAPEEPQFPLDEERAGALEDGSDTEEMVDALEVDEVHDLRELMARGLELLELDPELEPSALADPREPRRLAGDPDQPAVVVGASEDPDLPAQYDCMRPRDQPPTFTAARSRDGDPAAAEDGHVLGAVGGVADNADADADADDEAASTSGASSSFAPPDQLKRSTSLKSGKTPPHTPGRKKFVRFADAMGLDLQRVHTFRDEIPTVPAAAFRGLDMQARAASPPPAPAASFQMSFGSAALSAGGGGAPLRHLVPMFLQPGGSLCFLDRLRRERVVLENVTCDNDEFYVHGVVRVLNMDFHKAVFVRHTLDEWRTGPELRAEYLPGSCDGLSDRFRFTLHAASLMAGERLHFVVRLECLGQEYWDNNCGENYSVQMIRTSTASPMDEPGDWSGGRL